MDLTKFMEADMLFNSYIFILLFLPVALGLYYGFLKLNKVKWAQVSLIIMSLWFYGYFHLSYLLILVGSILFNYLFSRLLIRPGLEKWHRSLLTVGLLANVSVIFYFKYYNFFIENISRLLGRESALLNVLMPLGISFFTFQQISYLVDSYRGETKDYSFREYMLFVVFFPQLIAGPIVLHEEMIPQFRDESKRRFSQEKFAKGLWMFAIGLAKKVIVADTMAGTVNWGFSEIAGLGALDTVAVAVLYSLQIYFDFSGYCDMASGIAGMFHFELPVNFNSPYKAVSIIDFWKRWHMSLTRFLRKYIYFPLGGSKKGTGRTYLNIIIVFLVSGIWHGANWTFILWGVLHGGFQVLNRMGEKVWDKVPKVLRILCTFCVVTLLWVLFRADSVTDAFAMYGNLFKPWNEAMTPLLLQQSDVFEFKFLKEHIGLWNRITVAFPPLQMLLIMGTGLLITFFGKNCHEKEFKPGLGNAVGTVILLVWSILSLSGLSTFLYFNF